MSSLYGRRRGISLIEVLVVSFIILVVLGIGIGGCGGGAYSIIKAKTVTGIIDTVDNLTPIGVRGSTDGTVSYSFAVSIITDDEVFTFSAEDRQWGTVRKGDKVKARAFPYAPWDFSKAGTYKGGRLLKKFKQ